MVGAEVRADGTVLLPAADAVRLYGLLRCVLREEGPA